MVDAEAIREEARDTVIVRKGSCSQCGECCKPSVMIMATMLNVARTQCKYLDKPGALYICTITGGDFHDDLELKPGGVPDEDWEYFLANCRLYPEKRVTYDKNDALPDMCTFYWGEA